MPVKIKLSLQVPSMDPQRIDRFFSLRLKHKLENEVGISRSKNDIFVISDIGGDFSGFCKILIRGAVIDKALNWIFGAGHLVILGNCLDDNKDVIECLWLIYSLEEKAKRKGGYIHFIWGNNELENIHGSWRFRHPRYAVSNEPEGSLSTVLYDGSNELSRWLKTKNLIERIGHILFVHGTVSIKLLQANQSIEAINCLARASLKNPADLLKTPTVSSLFGDSIKCHERNELINVERCIDAILLKFGVKQIISGYQAGKTVSLSYAGKLINVHSVNKDALLIGGRYLVRVKNNGKREKLL